MTSDDERVTVLVCPGPIEGLVANSVDDGSSDFARWLEREEKAYFASHGRDATLDGFREHWVAICNRDPAIQKMLLESVVDAFIKNNPEAVFD